MMFSEVHQLLHILLTIPINSATAERTFSAMHRLKNFLRSSMKQVLFNNALISLSHLVLWSFIFTSSPANALRSIAILVIM